MINIKAVKEEFKNDECKIIENAIYIFLYYKDSEIVKFNKTSEKFYCYNNFDKYFELAVKNRWYERFYNVINKSRQKTLYYVRVFDGCRGYLNYDIDNHQYTVHTRDITFKFRTTFTKDEIEEMKIDEHIAIDWNKVKLIKANGD